MNKINFISRIAFNDGSLYLNENVNLKAVNNSEGNDPVVVEPPKK